MKSNVCRFGLALGPVLLLALSGPSQATSTDVVIDLEGNPTCSSLGPNNNILEYRDNSPPPDGIPRTVEVLRQDGGTQSITYIMGPVEDSNGMIQSGIVDWSVTGASNEFVNPINYTIVKSQGGSGARVFHFGGTGEITDTEEAGRSDNTAAVSFCYGLTVGFEPPDSINVGEILACEDLGSIDPTNDTGGVVGNPADLYEAGILCPDNGEELLIVNMGLNLPNFGFNQDNIRACTCNVEKDGDRVGLPTCNPDLPAVDIGDPGYEAPTSPEERSCMEFDSTVIGIPAGANVPPGVNERVPFVIMGVENPDSYVCYDIGGTRYCYGHY